ncbi:hypothetical protein RUM44_005645 [Polyplax serrata]|uniref:Uncharacterized protein n=1 Tax=Polyplax serrata TaxID=468196 RepID=A0ABR1ADZ9_POLSC
MFYNGFELPTGPDNNDSIEKLNSGEFVHLFELPFLKNLLLDLTSENNDRVVKDKLTSYLNFHVKPEDKNNSNEVLAAGLAPLILFIQQNWTGPEVNLSKELVEFNAFSKTINILQDLICDGENVLPVVQLPELLYISEKILEATFYTFKDSQNAKIWYMRCLFLHQQVLEELSPILFDKIMAVINEIRLTVDSISKADAIALHLEFGRIYMYYGNIQKLKEDVNHATNLCGLKLSLSGALGKRTKFQLENIAQLILKVNIDGEEILKDENKESICKLPTDLKLDDDVRLDKIKFADSLSDSFPDLSGLQQAVVLANLFLIEKSQPKDSLRDEELYPLLQCILDQPKVWSIKTTTLLLRSKLEANHKRTVERSMMQLQVLVDSIKDPKLSLSERSVLFFASHLPPIWQLRSVLADSLISMGSIKSALELYLNLECWEKVILCYNLLQMRHKAQEIIEQELNKDPSPKLWCLLGDAKDDVSCYQKAWELSNNRSARAQRHWALFYYSRQNYAESIKHFQMSLEINSLQKEMWYRLGYAALMEEKWDVSATAYRRYVVLDPECFEAWNNLGRCYCELKQKERAWRALQEALKVDYSNWKVWDNYMVVSSDLKMFDDVIKSYHQILNIKGKHVDLHVLNTLVLGFKMYESHEKDQDSSNFKNKFRSKVLELFGRLTSQVINDSELWFLYSEVVDNDTPENLMKKQQLLIKAHRSAMNKTGWEKNFNNCNRIIYILSKLMEVGLLIRKPDVLMSCKLAATGTLTKIKREYPDVDISKNLEKNMAEVENILNG